MGDDGLRRAEALLDAGVDAIIVDTAHGHSEGVLNQVTAIKRLSNAADVIGGNVATADGAEHHRRGRGRRESRHGPGTICTTRIVAGVGVPQLTAVVDAVEAARDHDVPVIADGGIKTSGDIAKAIAGGASACMVGSLLAGTDEAPGEVFLYQGRSYKSYRGMGSLGAMARGSADRYFQAEVSSELKLVPGASRARTYKGPANAILHQLVGVRCRERQRHDRRDAAELQLPEDHRSGPARVHVHDVSITKDAPNYARQN